MATWAEITEQVPELAERAWAYFSANKHKTMATLRADGSPRISGTELELRDGDLWLGGMPGSRKGADLKRDPRIAVHSASEDPSVWTGDAKIAGTAQHVTDAATHARYAGSLEQPPPGEFDLFRLDITELVVVALSEAKDRLVIESWHPGRGVTRTDRTCPHPPGLHPPNPQFRGRYRPKNVG